MLRGSNDQPVAQKPQEEIERMRTLAGLLLTTLCCVAALGIARADDSLRCAGKIISQGMQQSDVLQYCGAPDAKTVEDAAKREGRYYEGTTTVEHWTYTSGAVNTVLTFEAGVLVSIETE
jgi:hypothetical protein